MLSLFIWFQYNYQTNAFNSEFYLAEHLGNQFLHQTLFINDLIYFSIGSMKNFSYILGNLASYKLTPTKFAFIMTGLD